MTARRVGKVPPRYSLLLNPYPEERVSKCPRCRKPTHARKFALFIHIDKWGPLTLGKTYGYCTPCELVILHKHELETELAINMTRIAPEVVGNDYFVLGTVDKRVWQQGLREGGQTLGEALEHVAEFKKHFDLHVEPGGWRPAK